MKKRSLLIPALASAALLLASCDIMPPDFKDYSYPGDGVTSSQAQSSSQATSSSSAKSDETSKSDSSVSADSSASTSSATTVSTSESSVEPTPTKVTITVTDAPDWITNDGCVIFAWAWGGTEADAWYACVYGEGAKPTSFSFEVPADRTGCLLARCAANTTVPDWKKTAHEGGRIYNQSDDITITAGTTSYTSPSWKEYNPA